MTGGILSYSTAYLLIPMDGHILWITIYLWSIFLTCIFTALIQTLVSLSMDVANILPHVWGIISIFIHVCILAMDQKHGQVQNFIRIFILIVVLRSRLDVLLIDKYQLLKDPIAELDLILPDHKHCFEHLVQNVVKLIFLKLDPLNVIEDAIEVYL